MKYRNEIINSLLAFVVIIIAVFLKPAALIQSDDPQIKTQLGKITKPTDSSEQKAKKIVNWVYRNIEKKPTLSVPNALEVLKNKSGDCNEHSVLTVALLRAAGIPRRRRPLTAEPEVMKEFRRTIRSASGMRSR